MKAYSHRLREEKIFQSMSRKGNCLDNSVMENFFGLLKQEIYHGTVYYSYEELKTEIEKYIRYYNEKRIKEKMAVKHIPVGVIPMEDYGRMDGTKVLKYAYSLMNKG